MKFLVGKFWPARLFSPWLSTVLQPSHEKTPYILSWAAALIHLIKGRLVLANQQVAMLKRLTAELEDLAAKLRHTIARNPQDSRMEQIELEDVKQWIAIRQGNDNS